MTALFEKFDNLRILGIDRDPSKQPPSARFEWACVEVGQRGLDGGIELGLDIEASLKAKFPLSGGEGAGHCRHKALHGLDYKLQSELIRECAHALQPGGRFILFADTSGSADGAVDLEKVKGVHDELESLRHKLSDGSAVMPPGANAPASATQLGCLR